MKTTLNAINNKLIINLKYNCCKNFYNHYHPHHDNNQASFLPPF